MKHFWPRPPERHRDNSNKHPFLYEFPLTWWDDLVMDKRIQEGVVTSQGLHTLKPRNNQLQDGYVTRKRTRDNCNKIQKSNVIPP